MLKANLHKDSGILLLRPSGKLMAADFENLAKLVDPYISKNKKLKGLMIEAEKFPGWNDFAAMVSHVRFVKDHHKLIEKIAVVSDDNFLSKAPAVAKHFVRAKVQHFELARRDEAMAWISKGEQPRRPESTETHF